MRLYVMRAIYFSRHFTAVQLRSAVPATSIQTNVRRFSSNDSGRNRFSLSKPTEPAHSYWKFICLGGISALTLGYYLCSPDFRNIRFNFVVKAAQPVDRVEAVIKAEAAKPIKTMNFIADIVEKVAPAVVSIETEGATQTLFGPAQSRGNGSGFIVKADGLILTNAHVVQGFSRLVVTLQDGRKFDGIVEHYDSGTDLATIRIKAKDLPVLKLAESKLARPGEFVIAMGSPLSFTNSVTHGVISNVQRRIDESGNNHSNNGFFSSGLNISRTRNNMHYIQTDAPITYGNSGGPLINLDGEAVGINNMAVQGISGISFAIPSDYATDFLAKIDKNTNKSTMFQPLFKRKRLGVTMLTLDPEIIRELRFWNSDFPNIDHGILVYTVESKSAAQRAGIRRGDIITHVDQEPVYTPEQLTEKLQKSNSFTVTILRNSHIENLLIEFDA